MQTHRVRPRAASARAVLAGGLTALALSFFGCTADDLGEPGEDGEALSELEPGGRLGKADSAGVAGLPVNGSYAATRVWTVTNQWEETDTPAARQAGMAWPANSGLNWDEKYALWVESMNVVEGFESTTFEVVTPWGKRIEAAVLDCADVGLMLRASFAAWYELPFFVTAFDKGTPVHFGHFGMRTASGRWNSMPRFAQQYEDFSHLGDAALADWPQDTNLRSKGVQDGDEQPFLGPNARTGTYLDEIHLNKRAAHFIRLLLIFTGSPHLADSRNTFNVAPEAIREGDVNLHRWQAQGIGHTMIVLEVDNIEGGKLDVRLAEGSLPPIQPDLLDATGSALRLTNAEAGGADEDEDYAPFNGGLKRFRVAKNIGGKWTNTWMAADEASWINDSDLDAMRQRPITFGSLLGEVPPEERVAALLDIVETKREHLRDKPASCAARIKREEAFAAIYDTAVADLDMTKAEVDAMWRHADDYMFPELVYTKSKTCCWNKSTAQMYASIVAFNEAREEEAGACLPPLGFKAVDGDYAAFRDHDPSVWVEWSADETCPQADTVNDVEADHRWTDYCEWRDIAAGDEGDDDDDDDAQDGDDDDDDDDDDVGDEGDALSCTGHCGDVHPSEECYCDELCTEFGDCCGDYLALCE